MTTNEQLTRRKWLTLNALSNGVPWLLVVEAVSSTALEHPEWDMEERRTLAEWEHQC